MRAAAIILAAAMAVAACEPIPVEPKLPPEPPAAVLPSAPPAPDRLSEETAAYYRTVQANFLSRGLMRTDGGGVDTPYGVREVVDNFLQIALYTEYADRGGRLVAQPTASRLQRWERPVRVGVVFGPSLSPERQARDRQMLGAYVQRLARVTGHPIAMGEGPGNFTVLILSETERRNYAGELSRLMPGLSVATTRAILNMAPTDYCLVAASSDDTTGTYGRALAVIRAEHPDLLRLSCIHEELAQGLGLANDSPRARPSIFNDDEEFALLTDMDEILLSILYDRRLRPGMSEAEARPIVEEIAAEKLAPSG
jgi:hypothetical protein